MSRHALECIAFHAVSKGTLRGFATIVVRELKMTLHDVALHERESGARWAALPSRPMVDTSTKTVILDRTTGKIAYAPSISFDDAKIRDAFSHAVWEAVDAFNEGRGPRNDLFSIESDELDNRLAAQAATRDRREDLPSWDRPLRLGGGDDDPD